MCACGFVNIVLYITTDIVTTIHERYVLHYVTGLTSRFPLAGFGVETAEGEAIRRESARAVLIESIVIRITKLERSPTANIVGYVDICAGMLI